MTLITHQMGQHGQTQLRRRLGSHQDERRRSVRDGAGIGSRDGALLAECRFQMGDLVGPGLGRLLILGEQQGVTDSNLSQLGLESTALLGRQRTRQGSNGKSVHVGAGQTGAIRTQLGIMPHQLAFVSILQAIEEHVIQHALMPHAKTAARLVKQVRRPAHALHAAGDHYVGVTQTQAVCRQHHRLHARTTHLVDSGAWHTLRQACLQHSLTGGCLPHPGTEHIAHVGFIDLLSLEPGLCHGGSNGTSAELGSGQVGQGSLKGPHGGTLGRNNHNIHQLHSPCYMDITYAAPAVGTRLAGQLTFG